MKNKLIRMSMRKPGDTIILKSAKAVDYALWSYFQGEAGPVKCSYMGMVREVVQVIHRRRTDLLRVKETSGGRWFVPEEIWVEPMRKLYYTRFPDSQETLLDFGSPPHPIASLSRPLWFQEVRRLTTILVRRGYQLHPALGQGASDLSPLYTIRLDKGDGQGALPVDLSHLQRVVNQLFERRQTSIRGQVLEVHVLT